MNEETVKNWSLKKKPKVENAILKKEIMETFDERGMEVKNIILFGSRARGENTPYSDWDFLIIIKEDVSLNKKRKLAKVIREKLANLYIPCDVIIKSESETEYYRDFIGSVTREALKEGVVL